MSMLSHSASVTDAIDLFGNAQGTVSLSTTGAQSAALAEGLYDVWCADDVYIKIDPTASDVTTSTGYLLRAGNTIPLIVRQSHKIGGVLASGTSTLCYHKVK